LADKDIML